MVDGKRSMSELDKLGAGLGGGMPLLEQLLSHGWIAARDPGAPFVETMPFADSQPFSAVASEAALPSPLAPAASAVNKAPEAPAVLGFIDGRRLVVRFVNDQLGPMGEQTAMRVESCKNAAELQAQLPRVRDSLKNARGSGTVQRFDIEIVPQLPQP
jgi:hypothetical protein